MAVVAAKGIINAKNKEIVAKNEGHVTLGNGCVKSLSKRMNFLCKKKTTSTKPKLVARRSQGSTLTTLPPKYIYNPAVSNGPPAAYC